MGFLYESLTDTYDDGQPLIFASTVGHGDLLGGVGSTVRLFDGTTVGVIVAMQNDAYGDFRLIRVFESSRQHVDYSVRYWTGPAGMPVPGEVDLDDVVCHIGHGNGFNLHPETQARCYRLSTAMSAHEGPMDTVHFFPYVPAPGDSGSPVIHYETGQALGMFRTMNPVTQEGKAADVCSLIHGFADHGFYARLATASYDPPPARPTVPAPYTNPLFHELPYPEWWAFDSECIAG